MPEQTSPTPALSNKTYDVLKFIALVLLPALGTLYFTVGKIWNFPSVEEVLGTIVAIDTFLGVALGLNNSAYNNSDAKFDGVLNIFEPPGEDKKVFELSLNQGEPEQLAEKSEIVFKVIQKPTVIGEP